MGGERFSRRWSCTEPVNLAHVVGADTGDGYLNLLEVARLRVAARRAGLTDITAAGNHIRFAPVELPDSRQVRVQRLYPKTVLKPAVRTMLVPVPKTAARGGTPQSSTVGGQPLRDTELLTWCGEVIRSVLADL